jgi:hypothetical protein
MSIRSFSLNSREFYEAVREPEEEPWIKAGSLPREPKWPLRSDGVWDGPAQLVRGTGEQVHEKNDDEVAGGAFREWLGHVEAGRIGGA